MKTIEDIQKQVPTYPKFRLARKSWGERARWIIAPFVDDIELVRMGYVLGGQGRDASDLSESEQITLYNLLLKLKSRLTEIEEETLSNLLNRTPFTKYIGIIDIDINTKSPTYSPEISKIAACDFALKLAKSTKVNGLGLPSWFRSNDGGGFHANLIGPDDFKDVNLILAAKLLVNKLASKLNIPQYLYDKLPKKKIERTSVFLDDSVLTREACARGSVWRLEGTTKKKKGKILSGAKTLINVFDNLKPVSNYTSESIPRETLLSAVEEVKRLKLTEFAAKKKKPRVIKEQRTADIISAPTVISSTPKETIREKFSKIEPINSWDKELVDSDSTLTYIWNRINVEDRSRRDYDFIIRAMTLGAPNDQIIRLIYNMPGSKAVEDHRNVSYVNSVIKSAEKYLPFYKEDHTAPRILSKEELQFLFSFNTLNISKKLKRQFEKMYFCGREVNFKKGVRRIFRCELGSCLGCSIRRLNTQLTNIKETWTRLTTILVINFNDGDPKACQKALLNFKETLLNTLERKKAKRILSEMRTFRGPRTLLIVCPGEKHFKRLKSVFNETKLLTKIECIETVKDVLYKRIRRIECHLKSKSHKELLEDPWMRKVITVTSGKNSSTIGWLKKQEIRRFRHRKKQVIIKTASPLVVLQESKSIETIFPVFDECLVAADVREKPS